MSDGAQITEHQAALPPGFRRGMTFAAILFFFASRNRRLRALVFGLSRSRPRMFVVMSYFRRLIHQIGSGNLSFLPTIREDAELEFFELGTYRGREGWGETLRELRESFSATSMEMVELFDTGDHVLIVIRMEGRGSASGAGVEEVVYFVIEVEDGMAAGGRFIRERDLALKAAGLLE